MSQHVGLAVVDEVAELGAFSPQLVGNMLQRLGGAGAIGLDKSLAFVDVASPDKQMLAFAERGAWLRHGALADARQAHRLHQIIDPPGGNAANPGLLNHGDERLLGELPRL
ncbi:hypothetical protein GGR04_004717 [Aureimonas pseudogalii]|uniref:Uncharacterized protein n=1 Tax=Aureimonas pseudogalii TaxID=1744844 RepID=A0A7W6H923_9HYPH|nr:hypothetical protein [Aureimonas pseudogalii]